MSKTNNQSNCLDKIDFVQDITPKNAANYSGGVSLEGAQEVARGLFINGSDPDIIVFQDANEGGRTLEVNAARNRGIGNFDAVPGFGSLLDNQISSFTIRRGQWRFFTDKFYGGRASTRIGPGTYNLSSNWNDRISSFRRAA